jgi:hypothetical protein
MCKHTDLIMVMRTAIITASKHSFPKNEVLEAHIVGYDSILLDHFEEDFFCDTCFNVEYAPKELHSMIESKWMDKVLHHVSTYMRL